MRRAVDDQDYEKTKHMGRRNRHRAKRGTGKQRLAEAGRQDDII